MKIAYSKAIDHVRKKRMVKSDIDAVAESYFKTEQTPLKSTIATNRKEVIKKAINRLEPVEASVITLYYIQDVAVKDIADITGLTADHVKVKLFRARKNLKNIMEATLKEDLNDFIQY